MTRTTDDENKNAMLAALKAAGLRIDAREETAEAFSRKFNRCVWRALKKSNNVWIVRHDDRLFE